MANDMLLRDAVRAVKLKIQAAAASASPEELAYLGTAIDRIGGRATLLEVEELGDIKIQETHEAAMDVRAQVLAGIAVAKDSAIAEFTQTKEECVDTINATRVLAEASIRDSRDTMVSQASSTLVETTAAIKQAENTAVASVVAYKNAATTSVSEAAKELSDASAAAIQQALNGSMFINHFYASIR